jgi:hypothetical protein
MPPRWLIGTVIVVLVVGVGLTIAIRLQLG